MSFLFGPKKRVKAPPVVLTMSMTEQEKEHIEDITVRLASFDFKKCTVMLPDFIFLLKKYQSYLDDRKPQAAAEFALKVFGRYHLTSNFEINPYGDILKILAAFANCEKQFHGLKFLILPATEEEARTLIPLKLQYARPLFQTHAFLKNEKFEKNHPIAKYLDEVSTFIQLRQCEINMLRYMMFMHPTQTLDVFELAECLDSMIVWQIRGSKFQNVSKQGGRYNANMVEMDDNPDRYIPPDTHYVESFFAHARHKENHMQALILINLLENDPYYKIWLDEVKKARRGEGNNEKQEETKKKVLGEQQTNCSSDRASISSVESESSNKPEIYGAELEDVNLLAPIYDEQKSYTQVYNEHGESRAKRFKYREKERQAKDALRRDGQLPMDLRIKCRDKLRISMNYISTFSKVPLESHHDLNLTYPVEFDIEDDGFQKFFPQYLGLATLENMRERIAKKIRALESECVTKKLLWWENTQEELNAIRSADCYCFNVFGKNTDYFTIFEEYLGEPDVEVQRNRMNEKVRYCKARSYDMVKEVTKNDWDLVQMPLTPQKPIKTAASEKHVDQKGKELDKNSLLLQEMRKQSTNQLVILLLIVKAQHHLQNGNVIRCIPFLKMLVLQKPNFTTHLTNKPDWDGFTDMFTPFLMNLYQNLIAKFCLYSLDVYGQRFLSVEEATVIDSSFDHNKKCYEFCKSSRAFFFGICIADRHKIISKFMFDEIGPRHFVERSKVEEQYNKYFSMEPTCRTASYENFHRRERFPINEALFHIYNLWDLPELDVENAIDTINKKTNMPDYLKNWLTGQAAEGFLKFNKIKPAEVPAEEAVNVIPMVYRLPSHSQPELKSKYFAKPSELPMAFASAKDFVNRSKETWKTANPNCIKPKTNYEFNNGYTTFTECIENDVVMFVMYRGEIKPTNTQIPNFISDMCRKLRIQNGFMPLANITKHNNLGTVNRH